MLKKLLKQRNVQEKKCEITMKDEQKQQHGKKHVVHSTNELHCHFARFQIANKLRGNNLLSKYRNDNTFYIFLKKKQK